MSRRDPMYGIPEAALSEVVQTGEKGWRGEALKFCWARFGEEKELNYARQILSVSDSQISRLQTEFGTLTSTPLIESLGHLRKISESLDLDKNRLGRLLVIFRCEKRGPLLLPLLQKLETRMDEKEALLEQRRYEVSRCYETCVGELGSARLSRHTNQKCTRSHFHRAVSAQAWQTPDRHQTDTGCGRRKIFGELRSFV